VAQISIHRHFSYARHGQISKETGHAATQPDARSRLAPSKRPRRRILLVQQDRGRASLHQKGRALFFFSFSFFHHLSPLILRTFLCTYGHVIFGEFHFISDGERRPRLAQVGCVAVSNLIYNDPVHTASPAGEKRLRRADWPAHRL
jgi:hypothetical protein